jgi:predicted RNase H-like HicB family nuclease
MSSLTQAKDKKTQTFTAILYWEEDVYVAECPEVGTASQGETIAEAIVNLKEATKLYLEEFPLPETAPRRWKSTTGAQLPCKAVSNRTQSTL